MPLHLAFTRISMSSMVIVYIICYPKWVTSENEKEGANYLDTIGINWGIGIASRTLNLLKPESDTPYQ